MTKVLCAILLLALGATANATTFTQAWRINKSDNRAWFLSTSDRQVRSSKYNAATDHVVAVSRSGANQLVFLNADTGADVATSAVTATVGTFLINTCGITSDGVIYVSNLTTNDDTTNHKIYRFSSETGTQSVAFEGNVPGITAGRIGDTFDVSGTGLNTELWATNNQTAGPHLIKYTTTDGVTFTPTATLTATGGTVANIAAGTNSPTRLGLSVFGTGASAVVWGNGSGNWLFPRKFDPTTGAVLDELTTAPAPVGEPLGDTLATIGYTEIAGNKLVALGPGNFSPIWRPGSETGIVYNVNTPGSPIRVGNTESLQDAAWTNGDGTGTVFFDVARSRVGFNVTNNSISMWNITNPAVVSDWNLY